MSNKKYKEGFTSIPIESHETAALSNIAETKSISKVTIPNDFQIQEAKDWVDENRK